MLAEAVQELYPGTQITFGPATENGFYYDFARDEPFTPDDFAKIEAKMREIVDRDETIDARGLDARRGGRLVPQGTARSYKAEWVDELADGRGDHDLSPGQLARHVHAARICPRPASSARPSS